MLWDALVHAKGAGMHGTFTLTHPAAGLTYAKPLTSTSGTTVPLTILFAAVGGEPGSEGTARDLRGFAIKI